MIADGTIVRVHQFRAEVFETRNGDQDGTRVHMIHNITDQMIEWVVLPTRKHTTSRSVHCTTYLIIKLIFYNKKLIKNYLVVISPNKVMVGSDGRYRIVFL